MHGALQDPRRDPGHSDVEEHGFTIALNSDVKPVDWVSVPVLARRNEHWSAVFPFDHVENRIGGIRVHLIIKIGARVQSQIDPTGHDPEVDMRGVDLAPGVCHGTRFYRIETPFPGVEIGDDPAAYAKPVLNRATAFGVRLMIQ